MTDLTFGQPVLVLATVQRIISGRDGYTILRDRRDPKRGHGSISTVLDGWPGDPIPLPADPADPNAADGGYELEPAGSSNEVRLRRVQLDPPETGVVLGCCVRMEGTYHPAAPSYHGMDGWEEGDPAMFGAARRVRLCEVALPSLAEHRPARLVLVWHEDVMRR